MVCLWLVEKLGDIFSLVRRCWLLGATNTSTTTPSVRSIQITQVRNILAAIFSRYNKSNIQEYLAYLFIVARYEVIIDNSLVVHRKIGAVSRLDDAIAKPLPNESFWIKVF